MTNFDVAVGVNDQQLNACSRALFTAIPHLFEGAGTDSQYPGISMTWHAGQAPVFNLSPTVSTVTALQNKAKIEALAEHSLLLDEAGLRNTLTTAPAFDVNFPSLNITLTQGDNEQTQLDLDVTLSCLLSVSGNDVKLAASDASFKPLPDPMQNFFANNLVVPQLLAAANKALTGLSIPPPDMPGIQLSPIVATIQDNTIIALTNLLENGQATIPSGYQWPSSNFFALLSQQALQAVTNAAIGQTKTYSGKGNVGSSVGGADYHYSIDLKDPTVKISGSDLEINFGVKGNVGAKVTILWVPIGVNYDVEGQPSPEAKAKLEPAGQNKMNILVKDVNAFTFLLKPSGSVVEKIISAITWPITQAITAVVTPIITSFLHDINFTSYTLPAYKIAISGTQMQFVPQVKQVDNVQGMMAITGTLAVGS